MTVFATHEQRIVQLEKEVAMLLALSNVDEHINQIVKERIDKLDDEVFKPKLVPGHYRC